MPVPTLRQLSFLDAVAREASFSKAANASGVTQPTLSLAIKELEGLLGAQLIERHARGAVMTPVGLEVARRARAILADAQDLVAAAQEASRPLSGTFRLGAIPTIAPYVLPKILPGLRAAHPSMKLHLREETTDLLLEEVSARELDAAMIALPWSAPGIETAALARDEFLMIAPHGHPLAAKSPLTPKDLADSSVLLLERGHCLRDHAVSVCALPAQGLAEEVFATSLNTLVQMVDGGLGVSLVPRLAADAGITAGTDVVLRPFDSPLMGRTIGIAWRKGSPRKAEALLIGEAVKAALVAEGGTARAR
ncbi:MAG: hydrogen peroxide-inducible genes activator [Pseudomonadota bacterium]